MCSHCEGLRVRPSILFPAEVSRILWCTLTLSASQMPGMLMVFTHPALHRALALQTESWTWV